MGRNQCNNDRGSATVYVTQPTGFVAFCTPRQPVFAYGSVCIQDSTTAICLSYNDLSALTLWNIRVQADLCGAELPITGVGASGVPSSGVPFIVTLTAIVGLESVYWRASVTTSSSARAVLFQESVLSKLSSRECDPCPVPPPSSVIAGMPRLIG